MAELALIVKWLTSNPWRVACFGMALVILGMWFSLQGHKIAAQIAESERMKADAALITINAKFSAQDERLRLAVDEMVKLRRQQAKNAAHIKSLLDSWPSDCDDAARQALKVIKERTL